MYQKNEINPLRTHTYNITHSYVHNYSYMRYFTTNFTAFSKVLLLSIYKNFKTLHLGNIHTTISHRDTKNIHTDFYIHNQNTFSPFLTQKIKLHLTPNNLSQQNKIPTSIKNKIFSIGSVSIKRTYQVRWRLPFTTAKTKTKTKQKSTLLKKSLLNNCLIHIVISHPCALASTCSIILNLYPLEFHLLIYFS